MKGLIICDKFSSDVTFEKYPDQNYTTINVWGKNVVVKVQWDDFSFKTKKRIFSTFPEKIDSLFLVPDNKDKILCFKGIHFKNFSGEQKESGEIEFEYDFVFDYLEFYFDSKEFKLKSLENISAKLKAELIKRRFNQNDNCKI
jgi:hypothetical protein